MFVVILKIWDCLVYWIIDVLLVVSLIDLLEFLNWIFGLGIIWVFWNFMG